MILELVATCILGAGIIFLPPEGWVITKVLTEGQRNVCDGTVCNAVIVPVHPYNIVTLRRQIQVGDIVTAPEGCTMTMERKESEKAPAHK